jgi:hypothetical protein
VQEEQSRRAAGGQSANDAGACEFLGIRGANGTVHAGPSEAHRCFFGGYRLRPNARHQREYCLLDRTEECPIPTILEPRPDGSSSRRRRTQQQPSLWKRLLPGS